MPMYTSFGISGQIPLPTTVKMYQRISTQCIMSLKIPYGIHQDKIPIKQNIKSKGKKKCSSCLRTIPDFSCLTELAMILHLDCGRSWSQI